MQLNTFVDYTWQNICSCHYYFPDVTKQEFMILKIFFKFYEAYAFGQSIQSNT